MAKHGFGVKAYGDNFNPNMLSPDRFLTRRKTYSILDTNGVDPNGAAFTGKVDTWSDLSGNGSDFTQTTDAKRPTFSLTSPMLTLDGSDDFLNSGATVTGQAPITFYTHINADQPSGFSAVWACGGWDANQEGCMVSIDANGKIDFRVAPNTGARQQFTTTNAYVTSSDDYRFGFTWNGETNGTITIYVNGASVKEVTATTSWTGASVNNAYLGVYAFGTVGFLTGSFYDVFYDTTLVSATNMLKIDNHFTGRNA